MGLRLYGARALWGYGFIGLGLYGTKALWG